MRSECTLCPHALPDQQREPIHRLDAVEGTGGFEVCDTCLQLAFVETSEIYPEYVCLASKALGAPRLRLAGTEREFVVSVRWLVHLEQLQEEARSAETRALQRRAATP